MSDPATYARVAFNVPARRLFDYHLPPGATPVHALGRRTLAPLGNRDAVGIVMATTATPDVPPARLKTLHHLYDDMPPLPPPTLDLIRFCADYTHSPIGAAAACALPTFFRRANVYHPPSGYRRTPPTAATAAAAAALKGKARQLYALLAATPLRAADIATTLPHPHDALRKLTHLKLIEKCSLQPPPSSPTDGDSPLPPDTPPPPPEPNPAQQNVLEQLDLAPHFAPHLLFGATGSGKTEIYMRATAAILARGKQTLILTPEIHLTPQLSHTFAHRFPHHPPVILHSRLPHGERARRWLMAAGGAARIVLGTRLAVFTPMPDLGLIIVDEEHDDSYKQEDGGVLFSARNLAAWRAKRESVPFIAGSATPALESMHQVDKKRTTLLTMRDRHRGRAPRVTLIPATDNDYHGMDSAFLRRVAEALAAGEQCLLFINRRGYAPTLLCRQCHRAHGCRHCTHHMTVHRRRHLLACHLCGFTLPLPAACPHCGGAYAAQGSGTQRIEEALAKRFPDVRLLRIDRDSAGGKDGLADNLTAIRTGAVQLLIGTQLIAKGHDFPCLSLIGILGADDALAAADMRAEERLFALLSQVIGRGTRNPRGCEVIIQTRHPKHPFYRELAADDVAGCWRRLLKQRQEARLPPYAYLALLRGKDKNRAKVDRFMRAAATRARAAATPADEVQIFDPVSPPVEILGDWHRRQILLRARHRPALHAFLHRLLPTLPTTVHWTIDIDPLTV